MKEVPRIIGLSHAVTRNLEAPVSGACIAPDTAFGCPRDFLGQRFVYTVISPRAKGLSVGVNMNPDARCNFQCLYCEVDRQRPRRDLVLEIGAMEQELMQTLRMVKLGVLRSRPCYRSLPDELLQLRHVALSGDGEPTMAANFIEAVEAVLHVRALAVAPFFPVVLITNGTGLNRAEVREALDLLTGADEVWVKLDGGTQEYLNRVNGVEVPVQNILDNILEVGRTRPVTIQTLFPLIGEEGPPLTEVIQYALRLKKLKADGAKISMVQIYSATRPMHNPQCGHLSLKALSGIAQILRQATGLRVEVF